MAKQLFSNNATTLLAAGAAPGDTIIAVTSSALFPAPGGGDWFIATLQHLVAGVVTAQEIVQVTAVAGTVWTVVRAQEGTDALAWLAGDTVQLLPTAGGCAQFVQPAQAQAQGGNYAADTGAAGIYGVALTPPLVAHVVGMPIRWIAANANPGASTFNDGAGTAALVLPSGAALEGGEIDAGSLCTSVWDGAEFQLTEAVYATAANIATAVAAAVASVLTGTVAANGSISAPVAGSANGIVLKWGFHTPGTNTGAGLETIVFPVAFPHHCYFAAAFSNRNTPGVVGTGATLQSSLSTTQFQATLDRDASGNLSGLWIAIGD
jgi:hypothetical protein